MSRTVAAVAAVSACLALGLAPGARAQEPVIAVSDNGLSQAVLAEGKYAEDRDTAIDLVVNSVIPLRSLWVEPADTFILVTYTNDFTDYNVDLYLKGGLSLEQPATPLLTARIYAENWLAVGSGTVTVSLQNVNFSPPVMSVSLTQVVVPENAPGADTSLVVAAHVDLSGFVKAMRVEPAGQFRLSVRHLATSSEATVHLAPATAFDHETQPVVPVTVHATNPDNEEASLVVTLSIADVNEAPHVAVPLRRWVGQQPGETDWDLSPYFADVDGDPVSLSMAAASTGPITFTDQGGGVFRFGVPGGNADWQAFRVVAADGDGLAVTATVSVGMLADARPVGYHAGSQAVELVDGETTTLAASGYGFTAIAVGAGRTISLVSPVTGYQADLFSLTVTYDGKYAYGSVLIRAGFTVDADTQASHELTLRLSDGSRETQLGPLRFTIRATDDEAPVIAAASTLHIEENRLLGTTLYLAGAAVPGSALTITDVDTPPADVTVVLTGSDLFALAGPTGDVWSLVFVADTSLDHDTKPSHTLTVAASDGARETRATVIVEVLERDGYPYLKQPPAATLIYRYTLTIDLDDWFGDPQGSELAYQLAPGAGTGALSLSFPGGSRNLLELYHATGAASHELVTLIVADGANQLTTALSLSFVSNPPPRIHVLGSQTIAILENERTALEFTGVSILVTDAIGAGDYTDLFRLRIGSSHLTTSFTIGGSRAVVSVYLKAGLTIDRETTPELKLTVRAWDRLRALARHTLTLTVTDVDDEPSVPFFVGGTLITMTEGIAVDGGAANPVVVGVDDPDTPHGRFTARVRTARDGLFTMASAGGKRWTLQLLPGVELDHETGAFHWVYVTVSDTRTQQEFHFTYRLMVADANDRPSLTVRGGPPPVLVDGMAATAGFPIRAFRVSDENGDAITAMRAVPAALFTVAHASGGTLATLQFVTGVVFDHERAPVLTATVHATDSHGLDSRPTVLTFTVTAGDDEAPVPVANPAAVTVTENVTLDAQAVLQAGAVTATDVDTPLADLVASSADPRFALVAGDTAGVWDLAVTRDIAFNHETSAAVTVVVTVSDGRQEAMVPLTVTVADADEPFRNLVPNPWHVTFITQRPDGTAYPNILDLGDYFIDEDADDEITYNIPTSKPYWVDASPADGVLTATNTALTASDLNLLRVTVDGSVVQAFIRVFFVANEPPSLSVAVEQATAIPENTDLTAAFDTGVILHLTDLVPITSVRVEPASLYSVAFTPGGKDISLSLFFSPAVEQGVTATARYDYETLPFVQVTVFATDDAGLGSSTTVLLTIANVDDLAPLFNVSVPVASIAENLAVTAGTPTSISVNLIDLDSTPLVMSLTNSHADLFTVRLLSQGELIFNYQLDYRGVPAGFDHEAKDVYTISLTASDLVGNTSQAVVSVTVLDINEAPMVRQALPRLAFVTTAPNLVDIEAVFLEPDAGDTLTVTVEPAAYLTLSDDATTMTAAHGRVLADQVGRLVATDGTFTTTASFTFSFVGNLAPALVHAGRQLPVAEGTATAQLDTGIAITATDHEGVVGSVWVAAPTAVFTLVPTPLRSPTVYADLRVRAGATLDHEAQAHLTVSVVAGDGTGLRTTLLVTVAVTDVDDTPPLPLNPGVVIAVPEHVGQGAGVPLAGGGLTVADPDTPADGLHVAASDPRFTLVRDAGGAAVWTLAFATATTLDHEAAARHTVTVTVRDPGGNSASATFRIMVTDANDAPVVARPLQSRLDFLVGTGATHAIATLFADADGDDLTYAVSPADRFTVNDGVLTATSAVASATEVGELTASDGTATATLTFTFSFAASRPPRVAVRGRQDVTLVDGVRSPSAATGHTIVVTDDDVITAVQVSPAARFELRAVPGATRVTAVLLVRLGLLPDLDFLPTLTATVFATDAAGNISSPAWVELAVAAADTVAPVLTGPATPLTLAENLTVPAHVAVPGAMLAVTDPDTAIARLSLTHSEPALFTLLGSGRDSSWTLAFRQRTVLDHERRTGYTVSVTVRDGGNQMATAALTLLVDDVVEVPAQVRPLPRPVFQVGVTTNLVTLGAHFRPGGGGVLTYSTDVEDGIEPLIQVVDAAAGVVSFGYGTELLTVRWFTQDITVAEAATVAVTQRLTFGFVSDVPPAGSVTGSQELALTDGMTSALADTGQEVVFVDRHDNVVAMRVVPANIFTLAHSAAGPTMTATLRFRSGVALDHEAIAAYTATVHARDGQGLESPGELVVVTVTGIDDVAPTLHHEGLVTVVENVAYGVNAPVPAGVLTVVDADTAPADLTVAHDGGPRFRFLNDGGMAWTLALGEAAAFDHEAQDLLTVAVTVRDAGGQAATAAFTVTVADANDAPRVVGETFAVTFQTSLAQTFHVGSLFADEDAGDVLAYSATPADSFQVHGAIMVASHPDVAQGQEGTLVASDGERSATLRFAVAFSHNAAPRARVTGAQTLALTDGTPSTADATGLAVVYTDPDAGDTVVSVAVEPAAVFTVAYTPGAATVTASLRLRAGVPLDHEVAAELVATLYATDSAQRRDFGTAVTLVVTDVDDTAPVLVSVPAPMLAENVTLAANAALPGGVVEVVDPDTAAADLTVTLSPPDLFTLRHGGTGKRWSLAFRATTVPDHEGVPAYTVTVTATDPGGRASTMAVTVTVPDRNDAPYTLGTLAAQVFKAGVAHAVPVAGLFADDDAGDVLDFTAYPGTRFTVTDGVLTASAAAAVASATATVVASDGVEAVALTFAYAFVTNAAPVVTAPQTAPVLAESAGTTSYAAGSLVPGAALTVTDADSASDAVSLEVRGSGLFTVAGGVAGEWTLAFVAATALDHETQAAHTVTVLARDEFGQAGAATFTLMVTDVDEPARALAELVVGMNVTVTNHLDLDGYLADPEGAELTYTVTEVTDGGSYGIEFLDGSRATLAVYRTGTAPLTSTAAVTATDGTNPATFTFTFTFVDNPAPTARFLGRQTLAVLENEPTTLAFTGITFTVRDTVGSGDEARVASVWLETTAHFSLAYTLAGGGAHGSLFIRAGLVPDHEMTTAYVARLSVADAAGALALADASATVSVTDLDDTAPALDVGVTALTVTENASQPLLTALPGAHLRLADPDTGHGGFDIEVAGASTLFTLASAGGKAWTLALRQAVAFDHERRDLYTVSVAFTDGGGAAASAAFTVSVADVNERAVAQVFGRQTLTLADNLTSTLAGTGHTLVFTDPDHDTIASLRVAPATVFSLDHTSGGQTVTATLRFQGGIVLDYETVATYTATIAAIDSQGLEGTPTEIELAVTQGDGPVVLATLAAQQFPLATPVPFTLATLFAPEAPVEALTYSVTPAEHFQLVAGVLTATHTAAVSGQTATVVAAHGTQAVSIEFPYRFYANNPPVASLAASLGVVVENSAATVAVDTGIVFAFHDPDGDPLTGYRVAPATMFTLAHAPVAAGVSVTLRVRAGVTLDFEEHDLFTATVHGTDRWGQESTGTALTVSVADVDDVAPQLTTVPLVEWGENQFTRVGVPVAGANFTVTDIDTPAANLTVTDSHPSFSFFHTGTAKVWELRPQRVWRLDHERDDSYRISVTVTDRGGQAATAVVTISVTDLDEAPLLRVFNPAVTFQASVASTLAMSVWVFDVDGDDLTYAVRPTTNFTVAAGILTATSTVPVTNGLGTVVVADARHQLTFGFRFYFQEDELRLPDVPARLASFTVKLVTMTEHVPGDGAAHSVEYLSLVDPDTPAGGFSVEVGGIAGELFTMVNVDGLRWDLSLVPGRELDYEAEDFWHVFVTIHELEHGYTLADATRVTVADANDRPEISVLGRQVLALADGVPAVAADTGLGLAVADRNAGDTVTTLRVEPATRFTVAHAGAATLGTLRTKAGAVFDLAAEPRVTLTVHATDSAGLAAQPILVTLTVTPVVDPVPVLTTPATPVTVTENSPIAARSVLVTGAVTATDADSPLAALRAMTDDARFTMLAGAGPGVWDLAFRSRGSLDHEAAAAVTVAVTVSDEVGNTATAPLTVVVDDVDEPPRRTQAGAFTVHFITTAPGGGAYVNQLTLGDWFVDEDEGAVLTYTVSPAAHWTGTMVPGGVLTATSTSAVAAQEAMLTVSDGTFTVTAAFTYDFMANAAPTVVVARGQTATLIDGGQTRASLDLGFIFTATDAQRLATLLVDPLDSFVLRYTPGGTAVTATLFLSPLVFNGQTFAYHHDADLDEAVVLSVIAVDVAGVSSTAAVVTVSFSPVDDEPPRLEVLTGVATVTENTAVTAGAPTPLVVSLSDRDTPLAGLRVAHSAPGLFTLLTDGTDGLHTLGYRGATQGLDFEAQAIHAVTVSVVDGGGQVGRATVSVVVADINDAPAVLRQLPALEFHTLGANHVDVAGVFVDDEDGTALTYSVTPADRLAVSADGATLTATSAALAAGQVGHLVASDGTLSSTLAFTFSFVANAAPWLGVAGTQAPVVEGTVALPVDTGLVITAIDAEGLVGSVWVEPAAAFTLVHTPLRSPTLYAALRVRRGVALDHETAARVPVTVHAGDGAGRVATLVLELAVTDRDDTPPSLSQSATELFVPEHATLAAGAGVVGTRTAVAMGPRSLPVLVTDADGNLVVDRVAIDGPPLVGTVLTVTDPDTTPAALRLVTSDPRFTLVQGPGRRQPVGVGVPGGDGARP